MWLFLSESFLSIVRDNLNPGFLVVRARAAGDISTVFPGVKERHTPNRDYAYRASLHNSVVADRIARNIREIGYLNFKDSVVDDARHDACLDVWARMHRFQVARGMRQKRKPQHNRLPKPAPSLEQGGISDRLANFDDWGNRTRDRS